MAQKAIIAGNIYQVNDEKEVRYFQYFYTDQHYLGGNLIWVFNQNHVTTDLTEILESGYSFCFYTAIDAGLKLKKWKLIGNIEIPEKMKFYPVFRWRDLDSGKWYKLQYDQKELLGITLNEDELKILIVSFQFPIGAIEYIINGLDFFIKKTTDFESKYFEKNKKIM